MVQHVEFHDSRCAPHGSDVVVAFERGGGSCNESNPELECFQWGQFVSAPGVDELQFLDDGSEPERDHINLVRCQWFGEQYDILLAGERK